ncbi:MAG: neutral/alkaline non-lysosomal ceramidase N-terminal domain-containing protein [Thermoguttaceae bacterium]|jgi:neutral ceramidase
MHPRTLNHRSQFAALTASLMALAIAASSVMTATAASNEPGKFCAACVKVDITPDTPQWLHGYVPRLSTGVHDRLYHRIAALDDGTTTFYLVSTDICTVLPSFYHDCCARLQREAQVGPENIWWSTTHTHSGPHVGPHDLGRLFAGTLGDRFSIKDDTAYWASVVDKLVSGIKEAQSRLEPARLGIIASTAAANVNRRQRRADGKIVLGVNPEGPVDRQLGVLRLERPDGKLIGLIANYAVHGTALGGGNTLISGDVPGWAAQYVEQSTGVPLLFINGAEGNAAPLHSVGNNLQDPRLKEYDTLLGKRIVAANAAIANTTTAVKLRVGKTVIETPRKAGLGWVDALANYSSIAADGTPQVCVPVYSLTINGDTVIWAAPLELFSEVALNIRKASPFAHTFYFGLTNGSLLYLPTKAAFAEGGYEPNVSPFTDRAEADFTVGVTQYLGQLKGQP